MFVSFLKDSHIVVTIYYTIVRQELIPHTIMIDGSKKPRNLQLILQFLSSFISEKAQ